MFENSLIVVNIKLDNARWFLRGLNKPFDPFAQKAMHDTMIGIANCTEAVWAYHIGNEIVLYLNPNAISRCKTILAAAFPLMMNARETKRCRKTKTVRWAVSALLSMVCITCTFRPVPKQFCETV